MSQSYLCEAKFGTRESGTSNMDPYSSLQNPALSGAQTQCQDLASATPIPQSLFPLILADKKNIHEDFSRGDLFTSLFNERTLNDVHRGGIWVKMFKHSTLYQSLKELPNEELDYTLRNDEFDKRYGLRSSRDPSNMIFPDPVKMFNILRAYGNLDHEVFHA